MTTETITIVVNEKGARVVKRSLEDIGTSASKADKSVNTLKNALNGLAGYFAGREILRFIDSITILSTQLRNVTNSTAEYNKQFNALYKTAQKTGDAFGGIVGVYVQLNGALPDAIRNTTDLAKVTEVLSRGLAISGTSAQVAQAVMTQLSQGLSGNFANAAQELNSLIEGAPLLARIISEQLGGKASTDLKKMAEAGKLTARTFLDALIAAEATINGYSIPPTIERSWQRVKNAIMEMGAESEMLRVISHGLASAIDAVASNVDTLIKLLGTAAIAWGTYWLAVNVGAFATVVNGIIATGVAFFQLTAGMSLAAKAAAFFNVVLMANPIGFIAAAIGIAVGALVLFRSEIADGLRSVQIFGTNVQEIFMTVADVIFGTFAGLFAMLSGLFDKYIHTWVKLFKKLNDLTGGRIADKALVDAVYAESAEKAGRTMGENFDRGFKEATENGFLYRELTRDIKDPTQGLPPLAGKSIELPTVDEKSMKRLKDLLTEIKAPLVDYKTMISDLDQLYKSGKISLKEYTEYTARAREQFLDSVIVDDTISDGFNVQMEKMKLASRNGFAKVGEDIAKIFGPGGTLEEGLTQGINDAIVYGKKWNDVLKEVAKTVLSQVIPALLKAVAAQASASSSKSSGSGIFGSILSAVTGAFGGGSSFASSNVGIGIQSALGGGTFGPGFASGGYTGNIPASAVAGVVHGQEFVMNAAATRRNLPALQAMNAGRSAGGGNSNLELKVEINNQIPDAQYEVQQLDENRVEIIARRVVAEEAPSIIAGDLSNANSKTSKAMSKYTQTGRRRT